MILLLIACDNKVTKDSDNDTSEKLNTKLKVLLASNNTGNNNHAISLWSSMMPNFTFSQINYRTDTIVPAEVDSFDVIILYENGNNSSTTQAGDSLAEYVLNGGNVILGTFYGQGRTNLRYTNTNYGAIEDFDPVSGHVNAYSLDTLIVNSNHPLLDGVDTLTSQYGAGDTILNANAQLIARWNNGDIFAAYTEPAGRILYLSLWPGETDGWSPSSNINSLDIFVRVWANAIRYAYAKDTSPDDFISSLATKNKAVTRHESANDSNNGTGSKEK